ncbi:MAG: acetyl/propionyl/methylcrotonyl-CoA carboxylase subunit alpha [Gammaproteobacteria bacterium]
MFDKVLIANRGEIAVRIGQTAKKMGIVSVAVYSEPDRHALHVKACDEAWCIGPAAASDSYLCGDKIIDIAKRSGAQAIHPGYGFLSENAEFARACESAGLIFIGPPASAIEAMGSKIEAKKLIEAAGVALLPGYHGDDQQDAHLIKESKRIGYPQLIKASAGGGGKGMRVVDRASEFKASLVSVRREAQAAFGDDRVLIERYLTAPRHVEFQIFADTQGNIVHLYERDCSIQRRHQKIIEEAPAPGMSDTLRAQMGAAAIECARTIDYRGAGTVEFLLDTDGSFYFMEMNTRLQVEHPVTEMITGLDLVQWQFEVAAGAPLPLQQDEIPLRGHAFEARIYAEVPDRDFLPSSGQLKCVHTPEIMPQVRVDTGVVEGDEIGVYYDPMIAKLIVHGEDRSVALARLRHALSEYQILGVQTNIGFLESLVAIEAFREAQIDTGFIARHKTELFDSAGDVPHQAVLITALYLLLSRQGPAVSESATGDIYSPWRSGNGWRMNQPARHRLQFGDETREYLLEASALGQQWQIGFDGTDYLLSGKILSDNRLIVEIDSQRFNLPLIDENGRISFWYDRHQWQFRRLDPEHAALAGEVADHDLRAPMPGNVIALQVSEGDTVRCGDTVVVVEAMKMEHSIVAPIDATIKQIFFQVGDQVEEGDCLIRLE